MKEERNEVESEDPLSESERIAAHRALRRQSKEVRIPAVYCERGYLLLTLSRHDGNINYVDVRDGSYKSMSAKEFIEGGRDKDDKIVRGCFQEAPEELGYEPYALALNLLGRAVEGYWMSVRVKRRLIAMLTKEELMKLSERRLGAEYSRIMQLPKPISKIATDPAVRERYVDEILKKLAEQPEEQGPAAPADSPAGTANAGASSTEGAASVPAGQPQPQEKVMKKRKLSGAAKKKAESSVHVTYAKSSGPNPFREGTKKHKAYSVFQQGGTRQEVLAKVVKLGVSESTAATWVFIFSKDDKMKSLIAGAAKKAAKKAEAAKKKEQAKKDAKK